MSDRRPFSEEFFLPVSDFWLWAHCFFLLQQGSANYLESRPSVERSRKTRRPNDPEDCWWPQVDSNPNLLPTRENHPPRPEGPDNEFNLTWRPTRPDIMPSIPARLMGKPSPKGEQSTLTLSMAMLFFLIGKQMGKHSNSLAVAMMKLLFRLLIDYLGGSAVSYFLKI